MSKFIKKADFWQDMLRGRAVDTSRSPSAEEIMKVRRNKPKKNQQIGDLSGSTTLGKMTPEQQEVGLGYGIGQTPLMHSIRPHIPQISPEQYGHLWEENGYPRRGWRGEGGSFMEIDDPDKDKREGGYDLNEATIGYLPDETEEVQYGKVEELLSAGTVSPEEIGILFEAWQQGYEGYTRAAEFTREKWNHALRELDVERNSLEKTNFLNNAPSVCRKLIERIRNRVDEVKGMMSSMQTNLENSGKTLDEQLEMGKAIEKKLKSINPEAIQNASPEDKNEYLRLVALLYGADLQEMSENVLNIPYPQELQEFFDAAAALRSSSPSAPSERDWRQYIDRHAPPITDPEMAGKTRSREIIRDVDRYRSPVSVSPRGTMTPAMEAQAYPTTLEHEKELEILGKISQASEYLNEVISSLASKTLESSRVDQVFNKVLPHMVALLEGMAQMYVNNFVIEGRDGEPNKLHASFKVGSESKMMIFISIQNLANSFDKWYIATAGHSPLEALDPSRAARIAATNTHMIKMASKAEKMGIHKLADWLINIMKYC